MTARIRLEKTHSLDSKQIADVRIARNRGVPWVRLARQHGTSVVQLRKALGEPQWVATLDEQQTHRGLLEIGGAK